MSYSKKGRAKPNLYPRFAGALGAYTLSTCALGPVRTEPGGLLGLTAVEKDTNETDDVHPQKASEDFGSARNENQPTSKRKKAQATGQPPMLLAAQWNGKKGKDSEIRLSTRGWCPF